MTTTADTVAITNTDTASIAAADLKRLVALRESYEASVWKLVTKDAEVQAPVGAKDQVGEKLFADYVSLAGHLAKANSEDLYCAALYGLTAFQHGMWSAATEISKEVRFAASTTAALSEVMRGLVAFVLGMILLVYAAATLFIIVPGPMPINVPWMLKGNEDIILGTCFGFLGSIVSLLLRLSEFEVMRGRSRQFLFLTGFTLPIIGGTFAAVISALFASHVVSFSLSGQEGGTPALRLYVIVGFLSGFSERFSRSLLTSLEKRLVGSLDRSNRGARLAAEVSRSQTITEQHVRRDDPKDLPKPAKSEAHRDDGLEEKAQAGGKRSFPGPARRAWGPAPATAHEDPKLSPAEPSPKQPVDAGTDLPDAAGAEPGNAPRKAGP